MRVKAGWLHGVRHPKLLAPLLAQAQICFYHALQIGLIKVERRLYNTNLLNFLKFNMFVNSIQNPLGPRILK